VARHENEIGGTTDVADHPEFAARRATKVIDGHFDNRMVYGRTSHSPSSKHCVHAGAHSGNTRAG